MTTDDEREVKAQANRTTAKAAAAAKDGLDAVGANAERVLGATSERIDELRSSTIPALKDGVDLARSWIDDKTGDLQGSIQAAREKANEITDQIVDYTRDEPVKALWIAAAVGAGLMVLLRTMIRSRN